MSQNVEAKCRLLMEEEKKFAKRVVYQMRAHVPPPWWHLFIPFKFLLEYFAFRKNVRDFTEKHLLLKRMALSAACRAIKSGNRDQSRQEMLDELTDFCRNNPDPEFQKLYERLADMAEQLLAHYPLLLETQGRDYHSIVRNAYGGQAEYRQFLDRLEAAERRIDQAVQNTLGLESPDPSIRNRQEAVREVRRRDEREIFRQGRRIS